MSAKRHPHTFSALGWHFGPYGPQHVHVHSCFDDDCDRVLVGPGRDCDGKRATHRAVTLSDDEPVKLPKALAS